MNEADCLFLLHARIATAVTTKATILKIRAPFEVLSSNFGPHTLMKVATRVMSYATSTVCHLWILKLGSTRLACPRMRFAPIKLFMAPIARIPGKYELSRLQPDLGITYQ